MKLKNTTWKKQISKMLEKKSVWSYNEVTDHFQADFQTFINEGFSQYGDNSKEFYAIVKRATGFTSNKRLLNTSTGPLLSVYNDETKSSVLEDKASIKRECSAWVRKHFIDEDAGSLSVSGKFIEVQQEEVKNALDRMSKGKATSWDGMMDETLRKETLKTLTPKNLSKA